MRSQYARLYLCLERPRDFTETLRNNGGKTYIEEGDLKTFRMACGFAPADWRGFDPLQKGFTRRNGKVGLLKTALPKEGSADSAQGCRFYDAFRGRIMFPFGTAPAGECDFGTDFAVAG